jgi:hypothetical protein
MTEEERKVRKRANLDHLSQDEKMMRRKLKNRVAAQVGKQDQWAISLL